MPNFIKNYRDKEKCRKTRNRQRQRNYAKTAIYPPKEWAEEDDALVLEHKMSDRELSKLIEHSVQAIQVHRSRLKKRETEFRWIPDKEK